MAQYQEQEIVAKSEGGNFEKPDVGMHQAVCTYIHDIGTQRSEYAGEQIENRKVIITWELADKMTKGDYAGQPFAVNKYYTLSLNEKANLRKDLESWRGKKFTDDELKGFNLKKLIGVNCFLNLTTNDKDKRIISAITPLAKGMPVIAITNAVPSDKFTEWINKERAKSVEAEVELVKHTGTVDDGLVPPPMKASEYIKDDLPF